MLTKSMSFEILKYSYGIILIFMIVMMRSIQRLPFYWFLIVSLVVCFATTETVTAFLIEFKVATIEEQIGLVLMLLKVSLIVSFGISFSLSLADSSWRFRLFTYSINSNAQGASVCAKKVL